MLALILVLACSSYVVLAAPNAAQKQAEVQDLYAKLEKAMQQIEPDSDVETFKAAIQDDDDDLGDMKDLESLLADVQDSDEEMVAEKQTPNKDTADAQVTYRSLYNTARYYGNYGFRALNRMYYTIRRYQRTMRRYYRYLRRYRG